MEGLTARPGPTRTALQLPERRVLRCATLLQRALAAAVEHDCINIAQSVAYSSIVALFPALIVAAATIGYLPDTAPVHAELLSVFSRLFPPEVSRLLQGYFVSTPNNPTTLRGVVVAAVLSISGAASVIVTLMEGLRRTRDLPPDCWSFWRRRRRAYALVPLSLAPLAIASILVIFGHLITAWIVLHVPPSVRGPVYFTAVLIRWAVSLTASVGLIALLYHMGTPERQTWRRTVPGAVMATGTWFLTTLGFGWYVTRFANYSQVYGSLGAGIALLFWLFIVSFSVLFGAEFNAQFFPGTTVSSTLPLNTAAPKLQTPA